MEETTRAIANGSTKRDVTAVGRETEELLDTRGSATEDEDVQRRTRLVTLFEIAIKLEGRSKVTAGFERKRGVHRKFLGEIKSHETN